eukprot:Clim_evm15s165 gene=Clim_evmTU15s165
MFKRMPNRLLTVVQLIAILCLAYVVLFEWFHQSTGYQVRGRAFELHATYRKANPNEFVVTLATEYSAVVTIRAMEKHTGGIIETNEITSPRDTHKAFAISNFEDIKQVDLYFTVSNPGVTLYFDIYRGSNMLTHYAATVLADHAKYHIAWNDDFGDWEVHFFDDDHLLQNHAVRPESVLPFNQFSQQCYNAGFNPLWRIRTLDDPKQRYMIYTCKGGLSNNLSVLATALLEASCLGRVLVIMPMCNSHIHTSFDGGVFGYRELGPIRTVREPSSLRGRYEERDVQFGLTPWPVSVEISDQANPHNVWHNWPSASLQVLPPRFRKPVPVRWTDYFDLADKEEMPVTIDFVDFVNANRDFDGQVMSCLYHENLTRLKLSNFVADHWNDSVMCFMAPFLRELSGKLSNIQMNERSLNGCSAGMSYMTRRMSIVSRGKLPKVPKGMKSMVKEIEDIVEDDGTDPVHTLQTLGRGVVSVRWRQGDFEGYCQSTVQESKDLERCAWSKDYLIQRLTDFMVEHKNRYHTIIIVSETTLDKNWLHDVNVRIRKLIGNHALVVSLPAVRQALGKVRLEGTFRLLSLADMTMFENPDEVKQREQETRIAWQDRLLHGKDGEDARGLVNYFEQVQQWDEIFEDICLSVTSEVHIGNQWSSFDEFLISGLRRAIGKETNRL